MQQRSMERTGWVIPLQKFRSDLTVVPVPGGACPIFVGSVAVTKRGEDERLSAAS